MEMQRGYETWDVNHTQGAGKYFYRNLVITTSGLVSETLKICLANDNLLIYIVRNSANFC
jgi:hypothetical protein